LEKERAYRVEKKVLVELVRKIVKEVEGVYSIKKGGRSSKQIEKGNRGYLRNFCEKNRYSYQKN